jgi:hypothetical protein
MPDTIDTPLQAIEDWAELHLEALGPNRVWLAVAKATNPGWGVGKQVSESDFLTAISAASNLLILG